MEVAMVNRVTVGYLLSRGYKMDSFMAMPVIVDPFGRYDNYILINPPFSAQIGSV
jgi:hypothetical protein